MNAAQIKQEDQRRQAEREEHYQAMMDDKDVVGEEERCSSCNPSECKHYDFDGFEDWDEKGRFVEVTHHCKKYNKECPSKGCLKGTEPVINSAHYEKCGHSCENYFSMRSTFEYVFGKGRVYEVKHTCKKLEGKCPEESNGCPLGVK